MENPAQTDRSRGEQPLSRDEAVSMLVTSITDTHHGNAADALRALPHLGLDERLGLYSPACQ